MGKGRKQDEYVKAYAAQAVDLNRFVHAITQHPILRSEWWIWIFLGLPKDALDEIKTVTSTQRPSKSDHRHSIPICDATRE